MNPTRSVGLPSWMVVRGRPRCGLCVRVAGTADRAAWKLTDGEVGRRLLCSGCVVPVWCVLRFNADALIYSLTNIGPQPNELRGQRAVELCSATVSAPPHAHSGSVVGNIASAAASSVRSIQGWCGHAIRCGTYTVGVGIASAATMTGLEFLTTHMKISYLVDFGFDFLFAFLTNRSQQ